MDIIGRKKEISLFAKAISSRQAEFIAHGEKLQKNLIKI